MRTHHKLFLIVALTELLKMGCEPYQGIALDQRLRYGKSNGQTIPRASASAEFVNNSQALFIDVPSP